MFACILPEVINFNDDSLQDASIHNPLDYINSDNEGTFPLDPNEYTKKYYPRRERGGALCARSWIYPASGKGEGEAGRFGIK